MKNKKRGILSLLLIQTSAISDDVEPAVVFQQEDEIIETPRLSTGVFAPLNVASDEVVFSTNTTRINSIDPSFSASYYPGGRGANKLVVYTPNFGIHTGTNEFGTEAIVEDNTVVAISGADSTIPKNGIVISGHGIAKTWITQNITVGSKVYVDIMNKTLTVYTTSDSYMYEAKTKRM